MLTISTITEALAELSKQTGRTWTESELFDVATHRGLELHAAPPIGAKTTIEKYVDRVGIVQTIPRMPADFDYISAPFVGVNHPSRLAVVFPSEVEQLWLRGEVLVRHSHRYNEVEDETIVFFDPVRVTRELVRIKAATLEKIIQIWNDAQACSWVGSAKTGRWIDDANPMKYQRGPKWMFPTKQHTPAQTTSTPEPVLTGNDGPTPLTTADIARCLSGLRWNETQWKKTLGNKPKWLSECLAIPGQRGGNQSRWNPVFIGAALVHQGHVKANNVRAKFQTDGLLKPWLEAWKTYEADHLDMP